MSSIFGVSSTNNRITGMMSGIDTDSFVSGMTANLTARIAKQQAQIQLLNWKAQAYQGISSKLNNFSSTYMSYTSPLNALTSSFYSSKSVTASSDAVSVTGNSSMADKLKILSATYAQTANMVTTHGVASNSLNLKGLNLETQETSLLVGNTITFTYDGNSYEMKITDDMLVHDDTDLALLLQRTLDNTFMDEENGTDPLSDIIEVTVSGGQINFATKSGDPNTLKITAVSNGTASKLGITAGTETVHGDGGSTGNVINYTNGFIKDVKYDDDTAGSKMILDVNGTKVTITMPGYTSSADQAAFQQDIQDQVDAVLGLGKVTVNFDITTNGERDATLSFTPNDNTTVISVAQSDSLLASSSGSAKWYVGTSNRLGMYTALEDTDFATALTDNGLGQYEMVINGKTLYFDKTDTVQDMMDAINKSDANVKIEYLSTTNNFVLTSTISGAQGKVDVSDSGGSNMATVLFGTGEYDPITNPSGERRVTGGKDAVIDIEYGGVVSQLTRTSNTFDLDGLTITLDPNSGYDFAVDGPITFTSHNDTSDVVDRIKTMVDEFNSIIELLHKELKATYDREYPPLTEAQRKDMSDKEIEIWEEKAKAGLLNNDPTLRALANDIRFIFSGLDEYGISISTDWKENGKVIVDENALRKALEERPDELASKFTGTGGVMSKIKSVCDDYASTTGSKKGKLITIAGVEGGSVLIKDTQIQKQIESIEKNLNTLNRSLKLRQERYYRQFTALEVYIAKMSAQSSWLMEYDF